VGSQFDLGALIFLMEVDHELNLSGRINMGDAEVFAWGCKRI
jgi:hypothetical protein